tara:strand:+ start:556 stop:924 length:369 start_codon:yes stop_codon:yes gene_type:complete
MDRSVTYDNINDEFPVKVIFNGYDSYWKGEHQYPVFLKKNHKKLSFGYDRYWFVYGKVKFIHIFYDPCSTYAYYVGEVKNLKYMTIDKTKIKMWDDRKNFTIKFESEEDKEYFDEYYKKKLR